jgi:hypothetical protein
MLGGTLLKLPVEGQGLVERAGIDMLNTTVRKGQQIGIVKIGDLRPGSGPEQAQEEEYANRPGHSLKILNKEGHPQLQMTFQTNRCTTLIYNPKLM